SSIPPPVLAFAPCPRRWLLQRRRARSLGCSGWCSSARIAPARRRPSPPRPAVHSSVARPAAGAHPRATRRRPATQGGYRVRHREERAPSAAVTALPSRTARATRGVRVGAGPGPGPPRRDGRSRGGDGAGRTRCDHPHAACRADTPGAPHQNGRVRHLRLGLVLATAALLAAGCTDPSPEVEQPTSAQPSEESTGTATEDASSEADETPSATGAPEPPVFGTLVGMPGAPASACVAEALGAPLTFSTVLTAADAIVLDALTLETTPADAEPEVLDAWVLPFEGGPAGV